MSLAKPAINWSHVAGKRHALAKNNEARAVEYLYLEDLAKLFLGSAAGSQLPLTLCKTMTKLCQLRPAVMHPARPLLGARSPTELASLARGGEELLVGLDKLAPSGPEFERTRS